MYRKITHSRWLLCYQDKLVHLFSFQVRARPVKRAETRQGWEWWHSFLWPSMQCTCIPSFLCTVHSSHWYVQYLQRLNTIWALPVEEERRKKKNKMENFWVLFSQPCQYYFWSRCSIRVAKGRHLYLSFWAPLLCFSGSGSYTLRIDGHFKPMPCLT